MIRLARSVRDVYHSPTLLINDEVAKRRARGERVLHMGFGESPFPVPDRLRAALAASA